MKVVVNDANVLIDLIELDLLDPFFQLPMEFRATSLVLGEIEGPRQWELLKSHISAGSIIIHEPSEEEREEIYEAMEKVGRLSDKDLSAFIHARDLNAALLTSDDPLRRFGKENGVEVHGHLWALDHLVDKGQLDGRTAAQKLDELNQQVNQKLGLPKEECEKRKKRWKGEL